MEKNQTKYTIGWFLCVDISVVRYYICMNVKSCPTLCDPKDYSPPGYSVCGILHARILKWVTIPFTRGPSQPRDQTQSPAVQSDSLLSEPPETFKVKGKVAQTCLTLCNPMDYTVHGILQARIPEWVAFPFTRGFSQPRNRARVSCVAGGFFTSWAIREAQEYWSG